MDHAIYQKFRRRYLKQALESTNQSPGEVYRALVEISEPGWFSSHKEEKLRALHDLQQAFEDHRHWPMDIILSHLGIDTEDLKTVR